MLLKAEKQQEQQQQQQQQQQHTQGGLEHGEVLLKEDNNRRLGLRVALIHEPAIPKVVRYGV